MEHRNITIELERGPIPLFHQIAEALRYQIATGRIEAGAQLPPIRLAAQLWGVNLHTVRRAYAELAVDGLVETRSPTGTHVLASIPVAATSAIDAFVARTVEEAQSAHGLSLEQLTQRLKCWGRQPKNLQVIHFIECSTSQALGHCGEIETLWQVRAQAWCLKGESEGPPEGDLVATYFHFAEIKQRWPECLDRLRFVPIRPDPMLAERLAAADIVGGPLQLCERGESEAGNIVSDLRSMLPQHFEIEPRIVVDIDGLLQSSGPDPLLFSPRLWGTMNPDQQADPRVFEVRYLIDADALEAIGRHFHWTPIRRGR